MIRFLTGTVINREEKSLTLLVGGVGYLVLVPKNLTTGDEISLHIHTHVREDDISLFGFETAKDLKFFELLLSINGVGPKMALEILSEPAGQIQNAIFSGNLTGLTKISGVGKKIAERIILELKNKVVPEGEPEEVMETEVHPDVLITLENLGYKRSHVQKVLSRLEENLDEEAQIRFFLQNA
ncbi:Holliday junction branch migration protein RuvA [Patescibacteria group bacterium]|nr:Holliday junction branch migration protein RuvA [Patescibacteria group bacterium]